MNFNKQEGSKTDVNNGKICGTVYGGVDLKVYNWMIPGLEVGVEKCSEVPMETYVKILMIKVYPASFDALKEGALDLAKSQIGQALGPKEEFLRDRQGYCDMDVDDAMVAGYISWEKTFFDYEIRFMILFVPMLGNIKGTGEVGLKFGFHPEIGDDIGPKILKQSEPIQAACKGAMLIYGIPFAIITATGQIAVDLTLLKAGVGIDIKLVHVKLPATYEHFGGDNGGAGGIVLQGESMGGVIYGFVSVVSGFDWDFTREWDELARVTIYQWKSPASFTRGEIEPAITENSVIPAEPLAVGTDGPPEYVILSHFSRNAPTPPWQPAELPAEMYGNTGEHCTAVPEISDAPAEPFDSDSMYVGCFNDDGNRDMNCKYTHKNPAQCVAYCKTEGFRYAAIQAGYHCFCDNTYNTPAAHYVAAPDSDCGTEFPRTGGNWRNAVYRVVTTPDPWLIPPPTSAPTAPSIKYCTGGSDGIVCDKDAVATSEEFLLYPVGNDFVLKNSAGKFCADDGPKIFCNSDSIQQEARFRKQELGNDVIALISGRDGYTKYCSNDGAMGVSCLSDHLGSDERFILHLQPAKTPEGSEFRFAGSSELVTLKLCDKSVCDQGDNTVYEYFDLANKGTKSGSKRAFRNHDTKQFCTFNVLYSQTLAPEEQPLTCNENSITDAATVDVFEQGDDIVKIKTMKFSMKLVDFPDGFRTSGPAEKFTIQGQRDLEFGLTRYCNDRPEGIVCGQESVDESSYFNRFPIVHDNTTDAFVIQAVQSGMFCSYQAEKGMLVCDQDGYQRPSGVFIVHDMGHRRYVIRNEYVKMYCEDEDDNAPISCYRETVGREETFILDFDHSE